MRPQDLEERVTRAAEAALADHRFVSAIDVFVGLGWLAPSHLDTWRQGRVKCLERVVQANLHKITVAMAAYRRWAGARGLNPSATDYVARTPDRRPLRFSVSGDASIERAYRTHWVSPNLSPPAVERQSRPPELLVISAVKAWTCSSCGGTGDLPRRRRPAMPGAARAVPRPLRGATASSRAASRPGSAGRRRSPTARGG
jgi:hypothetical protein